jgi:hypothetical protein
VVINRNLPSRPFAPRKIHTCATWADIELEGAIIRVRNSKAGRLVEVSIHPALADELYAAGKSKILPTMISKEAQLADYVAAGIRAADDR